MSEIIYEGDAPEVLVGKTRLNGKDGAISLYIDSTETREMDDEIIIFENPNALFDFIDDLKRAAIEAGLVDGRVDA